jgi:hypothetical protein
MRKLTFVAIAVLVMGVLALIATPAMAQFGDPLTLAASGLILPYFGTGNNLSILEIASPAVQNPNLHFIFYNAVCTRIISFPTEQTANDVDLFTLASASGGIAPNNDGLVAVAGDSGTGFELAPLFTPVHARVYWINLGTNRFRVLEPILVDTADLVDAANWVPLRTAVTFFAPQELPGGLETTLYLICPKNTIQGGPNSAFPTSTFPVPEAVDPAVFLPTYPLGSLRARVFDDDEAFLADYQTDCDCLQTKTLSALNSAYATSDTYTEMETDGSFAGFTGYKGLTFGQMPNVDFFGRLSNTNRFYLQGIFAPATR